MQEIEAAKVKARPGHIPYATRSAHPALNRTHRSIISRIARHCWPWEIRQYPGIHACLRSIMSVTRWRTRDLLYGRLEPRPDELMRLRDYLKSHAQQSLTLAAECDQAIRVWRDPVRRGFLSVGKDGKSGRFIPKTKAERESTQPDSTDPKP